MLPIISLGLKVGMGALAGHKVAMRVMRPKKGMGRLPAVGVRSLGDIRVALAAQPNWANGVHFYKAAVTMFTRHDYANARNQINAAFRAAGIAGPFLENTDANSVLNAIRMYHGAYLRGGPLLGR